MNCTRLVGRLLAACLALAAAPSLAAGGGAVPVAPDASTEAKALLNLIYSLSGKHTLSGQHNFPNTKDTFTRQAAELAGQTPAVFSQDWGFAAAGDKDSFLARPDIVKEVIRQHKRGSIITLCWHAVPPTADEPVVFRRPRDAPAPEKLASVQGQLTDKQFRDVLTPGTELHERCCAQVDDVAGYLKQLQEARVPALWRPYHEMNGDWFWWGGRHGEHGTAALYRQLFDRYANHHKLNNLVWVWSLDRPEGEARRYEHFHPGDEYFDIAALDCYGEFKQPYYDALLEQAAGKPIVLGEVGRPPSPAVLDRQPRWALYVIWSGMFRWVGAERMQQLANDPRVLDLEDAAYREAVAEYRAACGLDPLGGGDSASP